MVSFIVYVFYHKKNLKKMQEFSFRVNEKPFECFRAHIIMQEAA